MGKAVSIIILISLIVAVLPLAQASENATVGSENESMTVTLFPLSDGCFSTVPEEKTRTGGPERITAKAKDDAMQVYYNEQDQTELFMRVNETVMVSAKEIKITDTKISNIRSVVEANDFSDRLTQDLYSIAEKSNAGEIEIAGLSV